MTRLFKNLKAQNVDRPKEGEDDCLIGYEYAAFHPNRIQAIGRLLLRHNRFGTIIGGTHPKLEEKPRKIVQHVVVHHANVNVQMEDFYSIERLGVVCSPRCGPCKCSQCHPGGKGMTIKEERESISLSKRNSSTSRNGKGGKLSTHGSKTPRAFQTTNHMFFAL